MVGIAVVAALLLVATLVAGWARQDHTTSTWAGHPATLDAAKPSFTLTDTSGHPYDFAARTKGKLTFLYFGYTHCPDVCPITLATLSGALADLSGVGANVVFVTTDPARDTPGRLRSWLDQYGSGFVGLTGTPAQLAAAQRSAGVTVASENTPDRNGNYTVGHAATVLVYTPDGIEHLAYPYGTTQGQWEHDIPAMLANGAWSRST
jgi:protein SCO1/2